MRLGSVAVESGQAQQLQRDVDQGHTPWRLDPLQVAREDGQKLGFASGDRFELLRQTGGQATVRAVHGGQTYEIQLTQPAKTGPSGIWMIGEVRRAS